MSCGFVSYPADRTPGIAAEAAADGAVEGGTADADAAAEVDADSPEIAKALRTVKLNLGAAALGGGALGTDVSIGALIGRWDVPNLCSTLPRSSRASGPSART